MLPMVSNLYKDITSMKQDLNFAWSKMEEMNNNRENSNQNNNVNYQEEEEDYSPFSMSSTRIVLKSWQIKPCLL